MFLNHLWYNCMALLLTKLTNSLLKIFTRARAFIFLIAEIPSLLVLIASRMIVGLVTYI